MSRLLLASAARLVQNFRKDRTLLRLMASKAAHPRKYDCSNQSKNQPPKPGYFKSGGTHAVLNDCPIPENDFHQAWSSKNSRYNLVLFSGLIALIGSMALCFTTMDFYFFDPEYVYTDEELEEMEKKEEEKLEKEEEKRLEREDRVYEREQSIKKRDAKAKLDQEVALMKKDIDEGLCDGDLETLQKLIAEREIFEKEQIEEEKRRKEELKQREKDKKAHEKAKKEKEKVAQKERERKKKEAAKNQ